ncbi:MAG: cob(I)yrinic acid a,c-diamide adenosyltransferase [bacterium]
MKIGPKKKWHKKGLIIVFTGDGKGKTTAAMGMALRAVGHDMRVIAIQFIKGRWASGEVTAAKRLLPNLTIIPMGEGFTWKDSDRERNIRIASQAWERCKEAMFSGGYDIVIFDEINNVIDYGFLSVDDVAQALERKPEGLHVVLTGRRAHPKIVELADLVTEMENIKHPYDLGVKAQRGIEF